MSTKIQNKENRKLTFIGFLFVMYFSLLACDNKQIYLYGGYVIIAGFVILDKLLSSDRLKIEFPRGCKILYYFTLYCYFSRIWAWNPQLVTMRAKFLIPIMIFVLICVNYFIKIQSCKACIYAIMYSGLALSIYVIVKNGGFSAFYKLATQQGNRIGSGGSMNVNDIGMICAFSVVVLFYYAVIRKKGYCYIVSVLPFIVSMASGSRKSIILIVVGVLSLILLSQKDKKGVIKFLKLIALLIISVVILKIVLSLDVMSTVNERMGQLFATLTGDSYNADSSSLARKHLIEVGWQQFRETPILGIGFGNSPILNWEKMRRYAYSHNDYVEHLVNGGIVSLLLYYGGVIYLLVKHIKLMKVNKKPELVLSLTTIIMYMVMGAACVTYYISMTTYLYFTLWISEVAICEREQREANLQTGYQ